MSNKTFAAVANYRARQLKELTDYLPVNAGDVGAIVDHHAFNDATTACRDDTIAAYKEVFGDLTDETLLRDAWASEDTPAVTLVASSVVPDPAAPLPICAPDADREQKIANWLALYDEDPLDVPAPDDGVDPPTPISERTGSPPDGAPGAGTQDDPALD